MLGRPFGPRPAVIVPASLGGAVAVMALCASILVSPEGPLDNPDFPQGTAGVVMNVCYAPLLLWGPLVMTLTVAYARRRRARR